MMAIFVETTLRCDSRGYWRSAIATAVVLSSSNITTQALWSIESLDIAGTAPVGEVRLHAG